MLFGEATPDLMAAIMGIGGVGGVAGLVGWVLKVGLPNVIDKFGAFITAQLDAAKADREAASVERAAIMDSHARQLSQRDEMFAMEMARLTEAVAQNTEANARATAVVESLSRTVATLAARVGVEPHEPVAAAPMPKPASGRNRQLPPGTIRGE